MLKKLTVAAALIVLICILLTSCYKIIYLPAPTENVTASAASASDVPATEGNTETDPVDPEGTSAAATAELTGSPGNAEPTAVIPVSQTATPVPATDAPAPTSTAATPESNPTAAPTADPDSVTDFGITVSGKGVQSVMGVFQITSGGSYYATGKSDPGCEVQININAPGQNVIVNVENLEINNNVLQPVNVVAAEKVTLVIYGSVKLTHNGSENASTFEDNVCILSNSDLAIEGGGKLTLKSSRSDAITALKAVEFNEATVSAEAKFNGVRAGDRLYITMSDIDVNAGRDGLVTENTNIGKDGARQGRILIDNSRINVRAISFGINAASYLDVRGEFTSVNVTIPYEDSDGTGIAGSEMVAFENGEIIISAPHTGIVSRKEVMYDNGDLSLGSISVFDGTVHINSGVNCVWAGSSLDIYGGGMELFDAECGFKAGSVEVRGGEMTFIVEKEAIASEGTVRVRDGRITARISGGDTAYKENEFIQEGGFIVLETNNGNGLFGGLGNCHFNGGTIICLGNTYALPSTSSTLCSVYFSNMAVNAGRTYSLGDAEAILFSFPVTYSGYSELWIASDVLKTGIVFRLTCKEEPDYTIFWGQNQKLEYVSPKE